MSFIQSQIKCGQCGREMNIATGTFGYGAPEKCPNCDSKDLNFLRAGWKVTCVKCKTEYQGGEFSTECPHTKLGEYDCSRCGHPMTVVYDEVAKKVTGYLYRCERVIDGAPCMPKNMVLSIG